MLKEKRVRYYVGVLFVCLVAFMIGALNMGVAASANSVSITDADTLNIQLEKLKYNELAKRTEIVVDGSESIDYSEYPHAPISLSNTEYDGKEFSVTFNVGVKNVYPKNGGDSLDNSEHYGLFCNVLLGYVPIYYRVNFKVGEGTLVDGYTHYKYGEDKSLPRVESIDENVTFLKWIIEGDESNTAVEEISSDDWGVKTFVAVYGEPINDGEGTSGIEQPANTHSIVYNNVLGASISSLENTYIEGEELELGTLSKEGFIFSGWKITGTDKMITSIPSEITEEYIDVNGNISFDAVWDLVTPSIVDFNGIDKVFDGSDTILSVKLGHSSLDELTMFYSWYQAKSEEDKLSPTACGEQSQLSFSGVEDGFYKVCVTAYHEGSGLKSVIIESEWVKVTISKGIIKPIKISEPIISKSYDGNRNVKEELVYGVHFSLEGVGNKDIKTIKTYASYDRSDVNAKEVSLLFGEIEFADGVNANNYSYESDYYVLYYKAGITPLNVLISPEDASKVYGEDDDLVKTIKTGIGEEVINIRYVRAQGENAGKYPYLGVEFVTTNLNYSLQFVANESEFTIIRKVPNLVFPSFKSTNFNPDSTILNLELESEGYVISNGKYKTELGEFYWLDAQTIPCVGNSGYIMVFVPNDKVNYDYTRVKGYSANGEIVIRNISLDILPIDPIPTAIAENFEVAIGMFWSKLSLPQGWTLVSTLTFDPAMFVNGETGQSVTYENALAYVQDNTQNYNVLYKDLIVNLVNPCIVYSYNGETIKAGSQTTINGELNSEITVGFTLENPFSKEGYLTTKWSIGSLDIVPRDDNDICVGTTYTIEDASLIQNEIIVEVYIEARTDIKVTYRHFYENLEGEFNESCDESIEYFDGVADGVRAIKQSDVRNRVGFNYIGACIAGVSGAYITEFKVSPKGDSVIEFYYSRNTISISYVDEKYLSYDHEGVMPQVENVKYGVPFDLKKPNEYLVYGYDFVGYTDGVTYEQNTLKIFKDKYAVMQDAMAIKFTLVMAPSENVGYLVRQYLDGELKEEIRYGTTGMTIDLSQEKQVGYERVTNENERLSGVISGYVLDAQGNVIKGKMLTLVAYYVSKYYQIEIDDSFGFDGLTLKEGETITLPEAPSAEAEGKTFKGWMIDGVLYMAGDTFIMPANNVALAPVWESVEEEYPNNDEMEGEGKSDLSNNNEGLGTGAIIGIVIASVVVLLGAVGLIIFIVVRKKKRLPLVGGTETVECRFEE